ncbi:KilA/APSES-type HTH DNA-binding domain [Cordyceps militaris CM01]|uniref:KilA/APSES-type HTH DNA-binding domain n=1 Tax=Cordyceps militaris (strain CM01) TaxID=983644 RepID=G3J6Q1_CORMM|nr:KilA/APSES-type HTH DNA-binding domain [Cordyceps militaris CM01]EGX95379.1 KilA/APSES-type HTH DNA-binding domain [Cordyceps militaris CM01]
MASTRTLPAKRNPLLIEDIPEYSDLVSRRRLGQTKLTPKMTGNDDGDATALVGVFDYAHLRAPMQKGIVSGIFKSSPNSYFLMRRSFDGYVSATGMFKATFPYADAADEEAERKYIKSLPTTSPEETAGNIWIPPQQALALAEEYQIASWIRALLDPAKITISPSNESSSSPVRKISAPPKFDLSKVAQPLLTPAASATGTASRRSQRSVSPAKSSSRKAPASPRKRSSKAAKAAADKEAGAVVNGDSESSVPRVTEFEPTVVLQPVQPYDDDDDDGIVRIVEEPVKVARGSDKKQTVTEVEVPLLTAGQPPSAEEIAAMVATAKEQVESAKEADKTAAAKSGAKPEAKKGKRKASDITPAEEGADKKDVAEPKESQPRSKRAKTDAEVRKDRVRNRAFIGIGATVAVGALVPWLVNFL